MIDIIVLMNNDLESLIKTLGSISFQNYKDIKVIIVNGTDVNLEDKLDLFSNLNISIMNCKSSNLRNFGLNRSTSKFVMFINSGDLLYNCFSISNILVDCDDYDLVTGKIAISYDNKVDFYDDLNRYTYGKLYNRSFIKKHSLRFAYSKYFSEMTFNKLYMMYKPRTGICSKEVYFTSNRIEEDNTKEYIIDYCKSFKMCIEEAIEKKLDNKLISKTLYSNICYLYNKYNINYNKKFIKCIFEYGLDIYNYYLQFIKSLTLTDKDKINVDYSLDIDYKCTMEEFLDMFTVKNE